MYRTRLTCLAGTTIKQAAIKAGLGAPYNYLGLYFDSLLSNFHPRRCRFWVQTTENDTDAFNWLVISHH